MNPLSITDIRLSRKDWLNLIFAVIVSRIVIYALGLIFLFYYRHESKALTLKMKAWYGL